VKRYCLCATAFLVRDGKTLLHRHKKLGMWLPPGGHVDEGEHPDEAVLREVREETGLAAEFLVPPAEPVMSGGRVLSLHQPQRVQVEEIPNHPSHIDLIYFMRAGAGPVRPGDGESADWRWLSAAELSDPEITDEIRDTARAAIALEARS
jgi:8-oxo-dGTP pyrophosphatase MutT (NUDIX family)